MNQEEHTSMARAGQEEKLRRGLARKASRQPAFAPPPQPGEPQFRHRGTQ